MDRVKVLKQFEELIEQGLFENGHAHFSNTGWWGIVDPKDRVLEIHSYPATFATPDMVFSFCKCGKPYLHENETDLDTEKVLARIKQTLI